MYICMKLDGEKNTVRNSMASYNNKQPCNRIKAY